MKNFVRPGHTLPHVAGAAIESGDFVEVGTLQGVATGKAAIGETVELALTGVYKLKNPDSVVVAKGAAVGVILASQKAVAAGGGDFDVTAMEASSGALDIPVLLPLGPGHSAR